MIGPVDQHQVLNFALQVVQKVGRIPREWIGGAVNDHRVAPEFADVRFQVLVLKAAVKCPAQLDLCEPKINVHHAFFLRRGPGPCLKVCQTATPRARPQRQRFHRIGGVGRKLDGDAAPHAEAQQAQACGVHFRTALQVVEGGLCVRNLVGERHLFERNFAVPAALKINSERCDSLGSQLDGKVLVHIAHLVFLAGKTVQQQDGGKFAAGIVRQRQRARNGSSDGHARFHGQSTGRQNTEQQPSEVFHL